VLTDPAVIAKMLDALRRPRAACACSTDTPRDPSRLRIAAFRTAHEAPPFLSPWKYARPARPLALRALPLLRTTGLRWTTLPGRVYLRLLVDLSFGGADPERQRLLVVGRPARAIILDVRPLGLEVSHGPVPTRIIEVSLMLDGGDGRAITVRDAVSELHVGRLLKGASVPVRVDPSGSQRLVVLWDTL